MRLDFARNPPSLPTTTEVAERTGPSTPPSMRTAPSQVMPPGISMPGWMIEMSSPWPMPSVSGRTVPASCSSYIAGATQSYTVPASGIVLFRYPAEGYYLAGGGNLPATSEVGGGSFFGYWEATTEDCNTTMQVSRHRSHLHAVV